MTISIAQAMVYGVLQGLTEFLPVSSSAHLSLLPWVLGWKDPGLAFDVALHAGTLAAVLLYFRKDWARLAADFLQGPFSDQARSARLIILASVPAAAAGLFFEKQAETVFRSPWVSAAMLALFGLLLGWADRRACARRDLSALDWPRALAVGVAQALAIVPGVSRSGATITAGLFLGLSREDAARFSFLLSAPIILGACLRKLPLLARSIGEPAVLCALAASALSGLLAIEWLLRLSRRIGYAPFAVYRILLAAVIAILALR
ncbi:MAG: undecaprenyl-diphosphate phosphatase [Elusimicrobiota bacterium]|jgi:undecaprenyl-diphosphatase